MWWLPQKEGLASIVLLQECSPYVHRNKSYFCMDILKYKIKQRKQIESDVR